jgi:hypothetical protein
VSREYTIARLFKERSLRPSVHTLNIQETQHKEKMITALIICGVAFTAMAARPIAEPAGIVLDPDAHMQLERKLMEKDAPGTPTPDAGMEKGIMESIMGQLQNVEKK